MSYSYSLPIFDQEIVDFSGESSESLESNSSHSLTTHVCRALSPDFEVEV